MASVACMSERNVSVMAESIKIGPRDGTLFAQIVIIVREAGSRRTPGFVLRTLAAYRARACLGPSVDTH